MSIVKLICFLQKHSPLQHRGDVEIHPKLVHHQILLRIGRQSVPNKVGQLLLLEMGDLVLDPALVFRVLHHKVLRGPRSTLKIKQGSLWPHNASIVTKQFVPFHFCIICHGNHLKQFFN